MLFIFFTEFQAGVNWLSFLSRYKLHGILCDDMGLGKTLQTICMIAGDHFDQAGLKRQGPNRLHSLVVCPPTLTGHWFYEVEKFVSSKYLKTLHYTGTPIERTRFVLVPIVNAHYFIKKK